MRKQAVAISIQGLLELFAIVSDNRTFVRSLPNNRSVIGIRSCVEHQKPQLAPSWETPGLLRRTQGIPSYSVLAGLLHFGKSWVSECVKRFEEAATSTDAGQAAEAGRAFSSSDAWPMPPPGGLPNPASPMDTISSTIDDHMVRFPSRLRSCASRGIR